MSGFDRLKEIGAQKIHEQTHITKQHVQAVLHESFEGINKIQFLGFISILEREYDLNLDDLKSSGLNYYNEQASTIVEPKKKVFLVTKKKKNYIPLYVGIAVVIFAVVAYFTLLPLSSMLDGNKVQELDNSAIESATSNISFVEEKVADANITTQEQNASILELKTPIIEEDTKKDEVVEEVQEIVVVEDAKTKETLVIVEDTQVIEPTKSLKVIANSRVWMGYIDLKTHKKRQKTFKDEFDMNASRDWLILLGHGYVNIEVDGVVTKFNSKNNLRLLYKDGNLTKIDTQEFKNLNNGSKW